MKIELHIDYFEEDETIVALCSELQVSSFGDTLDNAEMSIKDALYLFFEGSEELGTTNEVLEESGFKRASDQWIFCKPIKTMKTTLQRAAEAAAYA